MNVSDRTKGLNKNSLSRRKMLAALGSGAVGIASISQLPRNKADSLSFKHDKEFTLAVIPDTQEYARDPELTHYLNDQMEWIADPENQVRFAVHEGDLVNEESSEAQWDRVDEAMEILDNSNVPYSVLPGDHDLKEVLDEDSIGENPVKGGIYKQRFNEKRFQDQEGYIGSGPDGLSHYQKFGSEDLEFLSVSIPWNPDRNCLNAAQELMDENKDIPTIVNTHALLNEIAESHAREIEFLGELYGNQGQKIFEELVAPNKQVFMTNSGHYFQSLNPFDHGGEYHKISRNNNSQPVLETLSNYQNLRDGGQGYLRLFTFTPAENNRSYRIKAETYSPTLDEYRDTGDSSFSFEIDLGKRLDLN